MTTQTRVLPDLDEALDFEPKCEAKTCDLPADWWGHLTCGCNPNHFGCDAHVQADRGKARNWDLTCVRCGHTAPYADMIRWVRIR